MEVGGLPFLPKEACPLAWLWARPARGSPVTLFEAFFARGLESRGGLDGVGVRLPGAFFTLDARPGTGGGGEMGAGEEGCGEVA